jgi:1-deoxy-D-xylulose-5-phosphate reductoisomerase
VHSLVQFQDSSIKAQLGLPDMRLPIQFAMTYPERLPSNFPRFDFTKYPSLTFEQPDTETFRNLALAFEAMKRGGNSPCVLNAANEVAVESFLADKVGFLAMSDVVERCLEKVSFVAKPSYNDYVETNKETRARAKELIDLRI